MSTLSKFYFYDEEVSKFTHKERKRSLCPTLQKWNRIDVTLILADNILNKTLTSSSEINMQSASPMIEQLYSGPSWMVSLSAMLFTSTSWGIAQPFCSFSIVFTSERLILVRLLRQTKISASSDDQQLPLPLELRRSKNIIAKPQSTETSQNTNTIVVNYSHTT